MSGNCNKLRSLQENGTVRIFQKSGLLVPPKSCRIFFRWLSPIVLVVVASFNSRSSSHRSFRQEVYICVCVCPRTGPVRGSGAWEVLLRSVATKNIRLQTTGTLYLNHAPASQQLLQLASQCIAWRYVSTHKHPTQSIQRFEFSRLYFFLLGVPQVSV